MRPDHFLPYTKHHITPEDEAAVLAVLRSPYLTQGPEVERFEVALAEKAGAKYCVCSNSGTTALILAYLVAKQNGYRVAHVPAITFVATANAALLAGLDVRLTDCDSGTGLCHAPAQLNPLTDVMVSVALAGQPHFFIFPEEEARSISDACHGPISHQPHTWMTCLSFHPAKHVACGEGGAVLTNDVGTTELLRQFRNAGRSPNGWLVGLNGRMPEMAAALGLSQLRRYDAGIERRRAIARYYDAAHLPRHRHGDDACHTWHLYQILVNHRDAVALKLYEALIGTAVNYPVIPTVSQLTHLHGARHFAAQTLSIPMYPTLTDAEVEYVASTVKRVVEETSVQRH